MREEDARQVVDDIVALLLSPDIGLSELVEQHRDAVANGRVLEVAAEETPKQSVRADTRKLLPGDVRHRDLTVTEQLSGLIDLVEVAVAGTIDVEERTIEMAREFLPKDGNSTILFSDDRANLAETKTPAQSMRPAEDARAVTSPDTSRISAAREILETLRQLREATDVSRADWLEPQEERLSANLPGWRDS